MALKAKKGDTVVVKQTHVHGAFRTRKGWCGVVTSVSKHAIINGCKVSRVAQLCQVRFVVDGRVIYRSVLREFLTIKRNMIRRNQV